MLYALFECSLITKKSTLSDFSQNLGNGIYLLWLFAFRGIYGAFARLYASVCVLMQTFGPFKLCLSNTSESRVKWSRRDVWSDGLLLSSDNRLKKKHVFWKPSSLQLLLYYLQTSVYK